MTMAMTMAFVGDGSNVGHVQVGHTNVGHVQQSISYKHNQHAT